MPIIGLTDRGLSFPEIGQIRKGQKEERQRKDGSKYKIPVDLDYFRVEFDEQEQDTANKFLGVYGPEPQEINIILPFDEIERCWDAWLEAYTAGRMVARSDGNRFTYLVDTGAGEIIVKNGEPFKPYQEGQEVGKDYEGKSVFCKPVGRLKIIVPELARAAYMTVITTSVHDIGNLSMQLEAFKQLNNGVIKGIPLVLRRRPKPISVPTKDGGRVRMEKWLLAIEADPAWVRGKLIEVKNLALPDIEGLQFLPEGETIEGELMPGYEGPEHEEQEVVAPGQGPELTELSMESAIKVVNAEGVKYVDLDSETLLELWGKLKKSLNLRNIPEEQIEDRTYKMAAILAITASRQQQQQEKQQEQPQD